MSAIPAAAAPEYELAIAGGGMVGASLALALAGNRRAIALIEAVAPDSEAQPSFDERTTALGNGARRIFETLGIWEAIAARAAPIRQIHVSDAGHLGCARLSAEAHGLHAFGYTVSNRHLGRVLWDALAARPGVALFCPARVAAVELSAGAVSLRLARQPTASPTSTPAPLHAVTESLTASLAVGADGTHSLVKRAAGVATRVHDYGQVAVVAAVRSDCPAQGIAYERCTADGPVALLPRYDGSYAAILAGSPAIAQALADCDDEQFCARLQRRFGWRAGRFLAAGRRAHYPLALTEAAGCVGARVALIGNAAQSLHPIAAQGFNLGLRDAAVLAELVAAAADPGADAVLAEYARRRRRDRRAMIRFTDSLARLFNARGGAIATARALGMTLFDHSPPAKRSLSRLSWGFGPLPRLSRGLPLGKTDAGH